MRDELFRWGPTFFYVVFAIVVIVIIVKVGRVLAEGISNSLKPVCTGRARVIGKRTHVSGGGQYSVTRTTYYVSFELIEGGSRHELKVSSKQYGMLSEGDEGTLKYQGTRYRGFSRD
jgi:hypothetical protein